MSSFSDFLELELLDHAFGVASWTAPTNVYLGLFITTPPTDAGPGTEITVANGYARELITFGAAAAGAISNTIAIPFTASGGNWGDVIAVGIFDASTSGNMLAWDSITSATVNDGDTINFAIGAIDVTLT